MLPSSPGLCEKDSEQTLSTFTVIKRTANLSSHPMAETLAPIILYTVEHGSLLAAAPLFALDDEQKLQR
jgi:hypothetical protein